MWPTLSLSPLTFSGPVREAGRSEKRAYGRIDRHVQGVARKVDHFWGGVSP